jgi:flagellar biosynthesis anti-sigma factor FlgM
MRIQDAYGSYGLDGTGTTKAGGAGGAGGSSPKVGPSPTSSQQPSGEKVTLSADAQRASAQAESARVEQLRSSIADGSFRIDPRAIASRIVEGG